jgi:hypothetical protein
LGKDVISPQRLDALVRRMRLVPVAHRMGPLVVEIYEDSIRVLTRSAAAAAAAAAVAAAADQLDGSIRVETILRWTARGVGAMQSSRSSSRRAPQEAYQTHRLVGCGTTEIQKGRPVDLSRKKA